MVTLLTLEAQARSGVGPPAEILEGVARHVRRIQREISVGLTTPGIIQVECDLGIIQDVISMLAERGIVPGLRTCPRCGQLMR